MTENIKEQNRFNRVNIFTRDRRSNEPDWGSFERSQVIEKKAFEELRSKWKEDYWNSCSYQTRKIAGENLGYSGTRMALHEFLFFYNVFRRILI